MPHTDGHNPFTTDKLTTDNYNSASPENTIYKVPITLMGDQKPGGELDTGDGATVQIYLKLRFKFGKYNPDGDYYHSVESFESSENNYNQVVTENEITYGTQIGSSVTDLGGNLGNQYRDIQIPTANEILTYYGFQSEQIQGMELIECEILKVLWKGIAQEAMVRVNISGLEYPSADDWNDDDGNGYTGVYRRKRWSSEHLEDNPGVEQEYTYFKVPYQFSNYFGGHVDRDSLPIGIGQLIDFNSIQNTNILRTLDSSLISDDIVPSTTESSEDNSSTSLIYFEEESISNNFTIPNVSIEQSLKNSSDAFSAINLNGGMTIYENTELFFNEKNQDKRISLGMFFFNEDNTNNLNLPINFKNSMFRQIPNINLITNGDGNRIDKIYVDKSNNDISVYKPSGGWHFLNLQGIYTKVFEDDSNGSIIREYGGSDDDVRDSLRKFFTQYGEFELTNQGFTGYGGYYPYVPLGDDTSDYWKLLDEGDINNILYFSLGDEDFNSEYTDEYQGGLEAGENYLPEIASWVDFNALIDSADEDSENNPAFSNGKCLVLSGISSWSSEVNLFNFRQAFSEVADYATFGDNVLPALEASDGLSADILGNQYRVLNQTQKIYNSNDGTLNPHSSLKIRFKMKTTHIIDNSIPPQVEVGILSRNLHDDSKPANSTEYGNDWNESYGGFNSYNYPNTNFENQGSSELGGMIRVTNNSFNKWEDFEFDFTLTNHHLSVDADGNQIVKSLNFVVQAGNNFKGQVLLDNFEVYESSDFYPDCDVRKKISVGNYGKADLTQYYDPEKSQQREAYKDSIGPLEAQFYFYPRYTTKEIFDVNRTPIYNDFKKGLFYIYDLDWGDGSPKEFTSEPEQINEAKALYHTYEESGIFEVVGYMLRVKVDSDGNVIGLINNRKFKLRININEGLDEDFTYFGSEGFSFIPYRNTLPIIGGISKQSIYYKTLKRLLGFISDDFRTNINYKNIDTKLKLESALLKIDDSFESKLESDSMGGVLPYFESYINTFIEEGDVSLLRPKDDFYINNLEIVSLYCDVKVGGIEYSVTVDGNPNTQGNWWVVEFTDTGAQTFDRATNTEGMHSGFITDLNPTLNTTSFKLQDTYFSIDTGYSGASAAGQYDIENLYKYFTSEGKKIYIKFAISGNTYNIETTPDNSSTPQFYMMGGQQDIADVIKQDVFSDGSNVQGMDINDFNSLEEQTQDMYMDLISSLPFPQYFQEYDFFFNNGENVDDLYLNIERWEQVGRFDISFYLRTMQIWLASYEDNTSIDSILEELITQTYEDFDYQVQYLSNVGEQLVPPDNLLSTTYTDIFSGINGFKGELGKSIGDCDLTNIKYYNEPKSIWETFGFDGGDLREVGNPEEIRYWKNIIPKDYSIFNRSGLSSTEEERIDTYSQQEWFDGYYYPVLPKYGSDGKFIDGNFSNNKIPFPIQSNITNENESNKNLIINITAEKIENNAMNDKSKNKNIGFLISDYKPKFDTKSLKPQKRKSFNTLKTSKNNGVF